MKKFEYKQDLFYKDIPAGLTYKKLKMSTRLHFLQSKLEKCFFWNLNKPCLIYTGTNHLPLHKITMSKKGRSRLNKTGLIIFLYEPMCFYDSNTRHNRNFYSEFSFWNKKLKSDELDSIGFFLLENNLKNVQIKTCDYDGFNLLSDYYRHLDIKTNDLFLKSISVKKSINFNNDFQKKFWCGNGRYTQHRHLIMSFLTKFEGNYSWYFKCGFNALEDNTWIHHSLLNKKYTDNIINGNTILNNKLFYLDKARPIEQVEVNGVHIPPELWPNSNLKESYQDCFLAIVNETRFAQPFANISEKTLQAIFVGKPFILVAPPKSLEYIKKLGFKTFSEYWDESYDDEANPTLRIQKIFDLIEFINSIPLQELRNMYQSMQEILLHNIQTAEQLKFNKEDILPL